MYTRVYQGGKRPLPEDYHGTAFREEEEEIHPVLEEKAETEKIEEPLYPFPPCKECEEEAGERTCAQNAECFHEEARAQDAEKTEKDGWQGELLLLALCALLIECEQPDGRLLALLLLLLLSGNS